MIAQSFIEINPDCQFSISTVIREFPQNAVTPTNRDLERNTCPVHANARRMIKCLHKAGVAKDISISCRQISSESMCKSQHIDPNDPLTWDEKCVFGHCSKVHNFDIPIPMDKIHIIISVSLWRYQKSAEKGKNIFGLFTQQLSIKDAVGMFIKMIPQLRQHIYVAHYQWQVHAISRSKLDNSSIISNKK